MLLSLTIPLPLTNNSAIAGLDQGLIDYARIHARGAVKDMVPRRPGIKNPRPLLYWAIHPPENCAMMLLQRTPALAKLIATTPGVENMHDLAVLLADPVQQSAKQEKYVSNNRYHPPTTPVLHSFTHTAFYRVVWDNTTVGLFSLSPHFSSYGR